MKKILIKMIILLYIIIPIQKIKAIDTYSHNAILYNLNDDKIIFEKNSNEQVKVASLTKIMTTIVALEKIENIKEQVIMPKEAYYGLEGYVTSGIKPNEKITYEDILYGIMLPSGADCANAIAILTYGTIDNFVEKMNEKASNLNLENTNFSNPVGMDENNYSTVKDVSTLLKYALNNEEFYKIFTTKEYKTTNNIILKSTIIEKSQKNNLNSANILGSKTGFTDEAGNCLASISKINNINYMLITTKANGVNNVIDAINIYDYYSKNYGYKKILEYNQPITTIKINKKDYQINSNKDIYKYLKNDIDLTKMIYTYEGLTNLNYKNKKGEKIGTLTIKYENEVLAQDNIYLDRTIKNYNYINYLIVVIVILLIITTIIKIKKTIYKKKNI